MKIYRFDAGASQPITPYGSVGGSVARIAHLQGDYQVVCIAVDSGGKLGYHQAVLEQLFLVVQGNGEVRGAEDRWLPIHTGLAAFWRSGEWHETRTESGLVAIVIEGADLDPSQYMEEMA